MEDKTEKMYLYFAKEEARKMFLKKEILLEENTRIKLAESLGLSIWESEWFFEDLIKRGLITEKKCFVINPELKIT